MPRKKRHEIVERDIDRFKNSTSLRRCWSGYMMTVASETRLAIERCTSISIACWC